MNDGRSLDMKWDDNVNFSDVVNLDRTMTLMITLGGGTKPMMCVLIIIFQNKKLSFSIRDLPKLPIAVVQKVGWTLLCLRRVSTIKEF